MHLHSWAWEKKLPQRLLFCHWLPIPNPVLWRPSTRGQWNDPCLVQILAYCSYTHWLLCTRLWSHLWPVYFCSGFCCMCIAWLDSLHNEGNVQISRFEPNTRPILEPARPANITANNKDVDNGHILDSKLWKNPCYCRHIPVKMMLEKLCRIFYISVCDSDQYSVQSIVKQYILIYRQTTDSKLAKTCAVQILKHQKLPSLDWDGVKNANGNNIPHENAYGLCEIS